MKFTELKKIKENNKGYLFQRTTLEFVDGYYGPSFSTTNMACLDKPGALVYINDILDGTNEQRLVHGESIDIVNLDNMEVVAQIKSS